MKSPLISAITYAERLDGSVIVEFLDGRSALYSAALLFETIPLAREITDLPADD